MATPCTVKPGFSFTVYPCDIDSSDQLPITVDNQTPVKAEVVNRHREAIIAVESELGINPSSTYTTVKDRLDALEAGIGGISNISVSKNGSEVVSVVSDLNFTGGVNVTNSGSNIATIEILGGGGSGDAHQEQPSVSNNQTSFTLSNTPAEDDTVMMFINGLKQEYGVDYTVSSTSVTYSGSPSLTSSDVVEFWYLVAGGGGSGGGSITVQDEGTDVDVNAAVLNFTGAGVTASGGGGTVTVDIPGGGGGSSQTLSQTLDFGNTTDGYDIVVSSGDVITNASGDHLTFTTQDNVGGTADAAEFLLGDGDVGGSLFVTGGTGSAGSGGSINLNPGPGTTSGGGFSLITGNASSGSGGSISVTSGNGTTNGGNITFSAGDSTSSGSGGAYSFTAGNGSGSGGDGGQFTFSAGDAGTNANGGQIQITAGDGDGSGFGGALDLDAGGNNGSGTAGSVTINGGDNSSSGDGGNVVLSGGLSSTGTGGDVNITVGRGNSGASDGNIILDARSTGKILLAASDATISTLNRTTAATNTDNIVFQSGDTLNSGTSGNVTIESGSSGGSGSTGSVTIKSGEPSSGSGESSGDILLVTSPNSSATGQSGSISLTTGDGNAGSSGDIDLGIGAGHTNGSGNITLYVSDGGSGTTGDIYLVTGVTGGPTGAPSGEGNIYFETRSGSEITATSFDGDVNLNATGAGSITFTAGGSLVLDSGTALTWPSADGSSGQVLVTNGGGSLSFANQGVDEFTNSESGGGNPTLSVAPNDTHQVVDLNDGYNSDFTTDPGSNAYYQFKVTAIVKEETSGTYHRVSAVIDGVRSSGTLTTSGSQESLPGGNAAGVALTLTASGGSLNVNLDNNTGETVDGYIHVDWIESDEI